MANISILSRMVDGALRNVDLSTNTLVVDSIKVGGASGTALTKAILDNLVALQGGGDAGLLHNHDTAYYTKAQTDSAIAAAASAQNDASEINFAPVDEIAASNVQDAVAEVNSELRVLVGTAQSDATQAISDASAAQFSADGAQSDATQALADALAAQNTANQAVADASAAQSDATQALADASNAQTDATQALADAAAAQADIDQEILDRQQADTALQNAINAISSSLSWRQAAKAATEDAGLAAAADDTALSSLLPFSDDEGTQMVLADFADGDYILSKNGAASKVVKVIDDAGTLRVTSVGVQTLVSGHVMLVINDLPDTPANQEGASIYAFNGSDAVKVGDLDWSLATGIDLSPSFSAIAGTVAGGDSVESAISKLVANLAAVKVTADAAANKTLSNLTSPTAINQHLLPDTNNSRDVGSSALKFKDVWSVNLKGIQAIHNNNGFEVANFVQTTAPDGVQYPVSYFSSGPEDSLSVFSKNNTSNSAVASGDLALLTGNKTAGTGSSGAIKIATGTSAGGTRGKITLDASSVELKTNLLPDSGGSRNLGSSGSGFYNVFAAIYNIGSAHGLVQGIGNDLRIEASKVNGNIKLDLNGTGALDVSSKKIINVASGTAAGDAVNKSQLDTKQNASANLDEADTFFGATNITASQANTLINLSANADGLHQHARLVKQSTAGEAFAETTTFAVRFAMNGETAGRVYKADKDASTSDKFYVMGFAQANSATTAGQQIQVITHGTITLAANDTAFAAGDIGKGVFLTAAGGFSTTAPTDPNEAVVRVGVVEDVNKIFINMQVVGVN